MSTGSSLDAGVGDQQTLSPSLLVYTKVEHQSIPGRGSSQPFAQSQRQPIGSSLGPAICSPGETRPQIKSSGQLSRFLTADHVLFITTSLHLVPYESFHFAWEEMLVVSRRLFPSPRSRSRTPDRTVKDIQAGNHKPSRVMVLWSSQARGSEVTWPPTWPPNLATRPLAAALASQLYRPSSPSEAMTNPPKPSEGSCFKKSLPTP